MAPVSLSSFEWITRRLSKWLVITVFDLLLVLLCPASLTAQQKYAVKDLGTFGADSAANAISNNGLVVGYSTGPNGDRAFIWDKVNGMVEVGMPCPESFAISSAFGVNSKGQVVGVCGGFNAFTFLWDPINGARPLASANCAGSGGRGINENGQVSGSINVSVNCQEVIQTHAFRWDGTLHDLGVLSSSLQYPSSEGMAINKDGVVAGFSSSDSSLRAVLWGPAGIQNLGTLGYYSFARGINDSKQVVGQSAVPESPDDTHGFIWDTVSGMRDLGTLPGGVYSVANGINNGGLVVGKANSPNDFENPHAFLWDSRNGMRDLNNLIPPDSGWVLVEATAINDSGQIVGWGYHDGQQAAFLLNLVGGPLIFIPGNPGSYLVDKTTNSERWPGVGTFHDSLTLDPSNSRNQNIVATDAIRTFVAQILGVTVYQKDYYGPLLNMLTSRGGFREYQVNNDPTRRTTTGCDLNQKSADPDLNPNLFVFAYDWRKSNIENADKLRDYVGCVQQFYPDVKVDIIAHSNGGLLARRYILDNPGKVNRLITIATPWLGAPKAINVLETGDGGFDWRLIWKPTLKTLAEFFPSVHEVLPSESYYYLNGRPFAERGDFNENGIPDETYSYAQQTDLLNKRYPSAGSTPGSTNLIFHSFPGQDDWRTDTSGVEYHHIVGQQHTNQTIGQVIAQRLNVCVSSGFGFDCDDHEFFDTKMINGDRTVPIRSSLRQDFVGGVEVSLAPYSHFWKYSAANDAEDELFEHTALTQFPHVHDLILFLLDKGPDPGSHDIGRTLQRPNEKQVTNRQLALASRSASPATRNEKSLPRQKRGDGRELRSAHHRSDRASTIWPVSSASSMRPSSLQTSAPEIAPSYYVTVTGVDFVSVTDEAGNTNTQIDDTFAMSVPNVSYNLIGQKAVLVSMPADKTYTIKFRVGNEPISLSILKGLDNITPSQSVKYRDVVLPAGAVAMFKVGPNGIEGLRYDADGDGVFEATVTPTVSLIGSAAADTTAPTLTMNGTPQQSGVVITITAQDSETGVKAIYYSLDRTHYQHYTAPFTVNPTQTPIVYAFADDNAANRSGLAIYTVPRTLYNFSGFFSPVSNPPVLNSVNAGRAIPVKFSLGGNRGLNIFAAVPNNPGSGAITCDATAQLVNVEQTVAAGNSSLSYDAVADQYTYVWKTDSSWAGTCRQLVLQLNDGSIHRANFKFR